MTEDEARTKWCPKVVIMKKDDDTGYFSNRGEHAHHAEDISTGCIASECALWVSNIYTKDDHCGLIKP